MNKLILIFAAVLVMSCSNSAKAQCTLPYRALSTFNNDTTAYLKYNFTDRADCYKVKTFGEVVADLNIPIASFLPFNDGDIYGDSHLKCVGMYLYFTPYEDRDYRETILNVFFPAVIIEWKTPIQFSVIDEEEKISGNYNWTTNIYNLIKDKRVKCISTLKKDN